MASSACTWRTSSWQVQMCIITSFQIHATQRTLCGRAWVWTTTRTFPSPGTWKEPMVGTAQLYGDCPWLHCGLPWRAVCAHLAAVAQRLRLADLVAQRLHLADLEAVGDLEAVEDLEELAKAVAEALVQHLDEHEVAAERAHESSVSRDGGF